MTTSESFFGGAEKRLTKAQFRVVQELGRGPVKVVAAAGSGKTTTMAYLYAAAVVGGAAVGQIMAVTFTDRASAELKQKIRATLVEAGTAASPETDPLEGAWIGTFHTLIRRILSERAYLAGLPRDLELIDEVSAGMIMTEVLDSVRQQVAGPRSWLDNVPPNPDPRTLIGLVEGAGKTVGRLRSTVLEPEQCAQSSVSAYSQFAQAGDPPEEIAWHRVALRLTNTIWQEYERRLALRGALDFDGLLRQGLSSLRGSTRLLGWCRSNFQLVIVDEYQDTSALQESLILELTGPDQSSLFMVGDARQSIYAFRDAKPAILSDAPGRQFGLFRNHRSRLSILAAADHVIRADQQFSTDQPMEAARQQESPLAVFIAEVSDPFREAESIADALELIHRSGITYPDGSRQPVGWWEMAVLAYTQGRLGPSLEEALRRRRIPFQTATGGLLDRPEVKDVLALLKLAVDDRDDLAFMRVMQCQVGRLPDRALLALAPRPGQSGLSLAARLRDHLAEGGPGWDGDWCRRASQLLAVVEELRLAARTAPASELLATALHRSGLVRLQQARIRAGDPLGRRALASLRELQRVGWMGESASSWLGLNGLLERLEVMHQAARTAEPPPQTDEDLVTVSTIHRAKGLEWPVVVLADCRPHHPRPQESVLWDRQTGAVICTRIAGSGTEAFNRWKQSGDGAVDQEEHRRLVYVAMTRARDLLLVTTTRAGKAGEFVELREAAVAGNDWIREWTGFSGPVQLPWPTLAGAGSQELGTAGGGPRPPASPTRLFRRWEQIARLGGAAQPGPALPAQLSFTAIDLLNRCPRQFWYTYVARYPSDRLSGVAEAGARPEHEAAQPGTGREQARVLGTAVHKALEMVHAEHPDRAPTAAEALGALEQARPMLNPEQRSLAAPMLTAYAASPIAALPTVATEFAFSWRGWSEPGTPPLVGVIDRIARLGTGGLLILDYKTNASLAPADLAEYSRQLRLYASAIEAGVMGTPLSPPGTALLMLRSRQVIEVLSGPSQRREALSWAAGTAWRLRAGQYRSVEEFPDRPCAACPFRERCPERRPLSGSGLVRELEEPL